jgi:hypothetical protein
VNIHLFDNKPLQASFASQSLHQLDLLYKEPQEPSYTEDVSINKLRRLIRCHCTTKKVICRFMKPPAPEAETVKTPLE